MGKNGRMCQRTQLQNNAYANKSECTYIRDVRQLSKPEHLRAAASFCPIPIYTIVPRPS